MMASKKKNISLATRDILKNDETVVYALSGVYETKSLGSDTIKNGVLIATENRIVFYAKRFTGYDSESFKYSNISSIETGKKMMGSTITFYASGNKVSMKWIQEADYQEFVEYVEDKIGKKESTPAAAPQATDNLEELKKLKELLDMEAITEEEYEAKKKELLGL